MHSETVVTVVIVSIKKKFTKYYQLLKYQQISTEWTNLSFVIAANLHFHIFTINLMIPRLEGPSPYF